MVAFNSYLCLSSREWDAEVKPSHLLSSREDDPDRLRRRQFSPSSHLAAAIRRDCAEGDERLWKCREKEQ